MLAFCKAFCLQSAWCWRPSQSVLRCSVILHVCKALLQLHGWSRASSSQGNVFSGLGQSKRLQLDMKSESSSQTKPEPQTGSCSPRLHHPGACPSLCLCFPTWPKMGGTRHLSRLSASTSFDCTILILALVCLFHVIRPRLMLLDIQAVQTCRSWSKT